MKLPIGTIANFLLKRIVIKAIGKAIADGGNPLTKETAERAIRDAIRDEAFRQAGKVM